MGARAAAVVGAGATTGAGTNTSELTPEQRAELAERMRQRGGMGNLTARMILRERGSAPGAPVPVTSSRSRSDMFTRARRQRDRVPGQSTQPIMSSPAPAASGY